MSTLPNQRMAQTLTPNSHLNPNYQQSGLNNNQYGYKSGYDKSPQRPKIFQNQNYRSTYQPLSNNPSPNKQYQDSNTWLKEYQQTDFKGLNAQDLSKPDPQIRSKSVIANQSQYNQYQNIQQDQLIDQQQQYQYREYNSYNANDQLILNDNFEDEQIKRAANPKRATYTTSEGVDAAMVQQAVAPNLTSYQKEQLKDNMDIYFFHYNNQVAEQSYDPTIEKLVKQSEGVSACNIF